MGVRLTKSGWIGISLIVLSVSSYLGYAEWLATRNFTPLDTPLSLTRAFAKSYSFDINLQETYQSSVQVDYAFYYQHPECNAYNGSILRTQWRLWKGSRLVAEATNVDLAGDFIKEKGVYRIDVDVVSDASCLNPAHPRLIISTQDRDYRKYDLWSQWLCAFSLLLGLGLILSKPPTPSDVAEEQMQGLSIDHGKPHAYSTPRPTLRLIPCLAGLPSYGLIAGLLFLLLGVPIYFLLSPVTSLGIYVRLVRPDAPKADPWPEPLILRIESKWSGHDNTYRWFLNSKEIKQGELAVELRKQLALRAKWIVYVEADSNCAYGVAVDAIDIVRGLHATPVLLTPKTIDESKRAHQ